MGLFGNILRGIGYVVGSVTEAVGQVIGSETLENIGSSLKAICSFGSSQWNTASSVEKTVDVHKELERVKSSVEPQAKSLEAEMIGSCIEQVQTVYASFLPHVSGTALMLGQASCAEDIHVELADRIMVYINPRLSMDDRQCTQVLNIRDDEERTEACRRYQETVLNNAVESFKKDCIRTKERHILQILDLAEAGLKAQAQECRKLQQMLDDRLLHRMDESQIDLAREQILAGIEKFSLLQAISNQSYSPGADPVPERYDTMSGY